MEIPLPKRRFGRYNLPSLHTENVYNPSPFHKQNISPPRSPREEEACVTDSDLGSPVRRSVFFSWGNSQGYQENGPQADRFKWSEINPYKNGITNEGEVGWNNPLYKGFQEIILVVTCILGSGDNPRWYLPKKFGFFNQEVLLSPISERLKSIVKDNVDWVKILHVQILFPPQFFRESWVMPLLPPQDVWNL